MTDDERFERAYARALCAADPAAALDEMERDPSLPRAIRERLAAADRDGVRMTALLVARLRFERLVQGSLAAARAFEEDPEGFAAAFRRYHVEVPPTAYDGRGEARLYEAWSAGPARDPDPRSR